MPCETRRMFRDRITRESLAGSSNVLFDRGGRVLLDDMANSNESLSDAAELNLNQFEEIVPRRVSRPSRLRTRFMWIGLTLLCITLILIPVLYFFLGKSNLSQKFS